MDLEKEKFSYDKYINRFWLNYNDKDIQQEYIKKKKEQSYYIIVGQSLLMIILIIAFSVVNAINKNYDALIFRSSQLFILFLFYIKILKNYYIQQIIVFLILISNEIFFMIESIPNSIQENFNNAAMAIYTGILISLQLVVPLFLLDIWILQCVVFILMQIIVSLTLNLKLTTIITGIIFIFLITIIQYLIEKQKRKTFLDYYLQQQELAGWKMVLDEYIPMGVFMVMRSQDGQLKYSFINKWCNNLILQSKSTNIANLVNSVLIKSKVSQSFYQQLQTPTQRIELKTLQQKIDSYDFVQHEIYLNSIISTSSSDVRTEINCDVQMVGCSWQSDQSAIIIINEISNEIEKNRQKEINVYKQNVLATITHDLKTPLNGVVSILDALDGSNDIGQIHTYTQMVKYNVQLLYLTINNILDECQMIKGKIDLKIKQFDLIDMIQQLHELIIHLCREKEIKFSIQCNLGNNTQVINDQQRLRQLLYIIINNAIKYTHKGSINILIDKFENIEITKKNLIQDQLNEGQKQQLFVQKPNIISIQIKDTGIGMSQYVLSKLFQFFGILHKNCSKKQHGTGLGLVIAQNLVGSLGPIKKILVESKENVGSNFTLFIYQYIEKNRNHINSSHQSQYSSLIIKNKNKQKYPLSFPSYLYQNNKEDEIDKDQISNNTEENIEDDEQRINFGQNYAHQIKVDQKLEIQQLISPEFQHSQTQKDIMQLNQLYLQKTRVLIVDDTSFNIIGLRLLLNYNANIIVDTACNGEEAINMITKSISQELKYTIVFMDVNMPVMDGIEATVKLNNMIQSNQIYKFLIIITTTVDQQSDRQYFFEIGANELIPKPITLHDLVGCLTAVN